MYLDGSAINHQQACACGFVTCTAGTGLVCDAANNRCLHCPLTHVHLNGKCQPKSAAVDYMVARVPALVSDAWQANPAHTCTH